MGKKVAEYVVTIMVPYDTDHREVADAWMQCADFHERLERLFDDVGSDVSVEVENRVTVCPTCGQTCTH